MTARLRPPPHAPAQVAGGIGKPVSTVHHAIDDLPPVPESFVAFLRAAHARFGPDGCWPFAGLDRHGYGRVRFGAPKVTVSTHRLAYLLLVGPIPPGLTIQHNCDSPACANPAHLEVMSMRANNALGNSVSAQLARLTQCQRGHELAAPNLTGERRRRQCRACATARWVAGCRGRRGDEGFIQSYADAFYARLQ